MTHIKYHLNLIVNLMSEIVAKYKIDKMYKFKDKINGKQTFGTKIKVDVKFRANKILLSFKKNACIN